LWSHTYEWPVDDVFKVQDDISAEVVRALELVINDKEQAEGGNTDNLDAYELFMHARKLYQNLNRADIEKAVMLLEQAVALDPKFARAWLELSYGYLKEADNGLLEPADGESKARKAIEAVLRIDPRLPAAHAWLSRMYMNEGNYKAASGEIEVGASINPTSMDIIQAKRLFAYRQGRWEEAVRLARQVLTRDPLDVLNQYWLWACLMATGQYQDAERAYRLGLTIAPQSEKLHMLIGETMVLSGHPTEGLAEMLLEPDEALRLWGKALALSAMGRRDEADAVLAEKDKKYPADPTLTGAVYAVRGDAQLALDWLERAKAMHDENLADVQFIYAPFPEVTRDARYQALLRTMNTAR
jgi:tetratricopeptide (TPR) repeat protein